MSYVSNPFTVLSIDPGSNHLGYAYSKVSFEDGVSKFDVLEYGTASPSKYTGELKSYCKQFNGRVLTGKAVVAILDDLHDTYHPDFLVSEDAFYNPLRPSASLSLLITIYAIETALFDRYQRGVIKEPRDAVLYKIPPTLIKKVVSKEGGKAKKFDMYKAMCDLITTNLITFAGTSIAPKFENMEEHAVDAVCIGYAFNKIWIPIIKADILDTTQTSFTKAVKNTLRKLHWNSEYITL